MPKGIPKSGHRKPGAGPKAKNGPTTTIAFRVPITHEARIKMLVRNYLKDLKKSQEWATLKYSEKDFEEIMSGAWQKQEPLN